MRSRWALAVATGVAAATVVAGPAYAEPVRPFSPYGPAPAGSHVRVSDGGLTITSPRADGGLSVTIYRTASGVSGATLLRDFAAANLVSASMAAEATSEAVLLVDPTPGHPVTTCRGRERPWSGLPWEPKLHDQVPVAHPERTRQSARVLPRPHAMAVAGTQLGDEVEHGQSRAQLYRRWLDSRKLPVAELVRRRMEFLLHR